MCPSMIRQFGNSESRTKEMNSNLMIMTYNTFAFEYYSNEVRNYLKSVRERGVLIVDECDRMMEEDVIGGHETFKRIFCSSERWNVVGMSATPDKLIKGFEDVLDISLEFHQLDNSYKKDHVRFTRVLGNSGSMAGYLGENRSEEALKAVKLLKPEGHQIKVSAKGKRVEVLGLIHSL